MNNVHYSSKSSEWETPSYIFKVRRDMHNIILDTCATKENTKCNVYFDKKTNGLKQDWSVVKEFGRTASCWMNPPYGRNIGEWVAKAHKEALNGVKTVALLPARTDTKWFHNYILGKYDIEFLKGRIKFANAKSSAPFPSMIVIFETTRLERFVNKVKALIKKVNRKWKK